MKRFPYNMEKLLKGKVYTFSEGIMKVCLVRKRGIRGSL